MEQTAPPWQASPSSHGLPSGIAVMTQDWDASSHVPWTHADPVGQGLGTPTQKPAWQVSSIVQKSPSSQGDPSSRAVMAQCPAEQTPVEQEVTPQVVPSELFWVTQPTPGAQAALRHSVWRDEQASGPGWQRPAAQVPGPSQGLPSSQAWPSFPPMEVHAWDASTHSPTWHASVAGHARGRPEQDPPVQASPTVQ
jgi:hypothetical protein